MPFEPSEITCLPDQATDVHPILKKGFHQMAADETRSSGNERLQRVSSSTLIMRKDLSILSVFLNLSRRNPVRIV
jgi:hypothetical protein